MLLAPEINVINWVGIGTLIFELLKGISVGGNAAMEWMRSETGTRGPL